MVLHVTVSEPQQHGEGRNRYTSYLVSVIDTSSFASSSSVRRRYSDFQWLYNRLVNHDKPGAIVPIIPHRQAVQPSKRFSDELIQERLVQLNKFLQSVITHPELNDASSLHVFLRGEEEAFDKAKKNSNGGLDSENGSDAGGSEFNTPESSPNKLPSHHSNGTSPPTNGATESVSPTAKKASPEKLRNLLVRTAASLSFRGGSSFNELLQRTSDEETFDELDMYVRQIDGCAKTLQEEGTKLVKNAKEEGEKMRIVSETFQALSKLSRKTTKTNKSARADTNSNENGTANDKGTPSSPSGSNCGNCDSATIYGQLCSTTNAIAHLTIKKSTNETASFLQSLQDINRIIQSIKIAIQKRREKQITYTARTKEISMKESALTRLRNNKNAKTNEQKIQHIEKELVRLNRVSEQEREDLNLVSKRVIREVDRIRLSLNQHIRACLVQYGHLQMEHNRKMDGLWSKLISSSLQPSSSSSSTNMSSSLSDKNSLANFDNDDNSQNNLSFWDNGEHEWSERRAVVSSLLRPSPLTQLSPISSASGEEDNEVKMMGSF